MPALVSVVIPVYNGARFLREAIDSVLGQTYSPVQVIVVDDGSVDGSPEVIRSYGSRLESIRQPNSGVAQARNRGIAASRGEFIAFLDQDDWWRPEKIRRQVESFVQHPDVGLVHTEAAHYDNPSAAFVERFNPNRSDLLTGRCYERLLLGNAIFNSSVIIRKSVLDKVGAFDTQIEGNTIQDYDLWLRIARASSLAYISEQLTVYRLHPEQGMWKARHSLMEELRLLDRIVSNTIAPLSPEMHGRMAKLLDEVGVAHFDVREVAVARRCFARALQHRWSWRNALLLSLTFLPWRWSEGVRRAATALRTLGRKPVVHRAPSWVSLK
jgi:glycosyltransferase involved in cell wall biosynthesis